MSEAVVKPITSPIVVTADELKQLAVRLKTMALAHDAHPDIILAARIVKRMVTNGEVITSVSLPPLITASRDSDLPAVSHSSSQASS